MKNAEEALNERVLDEQIYWYNNTYLSRLEEGAKQIIVMTRWATNDLCGYFLQVEPDEWCVLKYPVMSDVLEDGSEPEMLCPDLMSYESFYDNTKPGKMSEYIVRANYFQEPIDEKGRLYKHFKTYRELPTRFERIIGYIDTADTGNDFLCCVIGGVLEGEVYILDVYFTQDSMEITEPATAKLLHDFKVQKIKVESNNGGRGFARTIRRLLWELFRDRSVSIVPFVQRKNKTARIRNAATFVMEHFYFPEDWEFRWPEYYRSMMRYQERGSNRHDDAQDATTGLRGNDSI